MNSITTIQFLKQNPLAHFLRITDMTNDSFIGKKDTYLSDIPNEDLIQYIKNLLNGREAEVWIEHRQIKGASNVKIGQSYKMNFILEKPVETPVQAPAITPVVQSQPITAEPMMNHAALGNPFGLSAPQIMDNMMKANKLEDVKEQYSELKQDFLDLKRKHDSLDDENRRLKTDLSIAQREKEMAVLSEKMEKRSFFDSPAFEKLMEKAPDMVENVIALKMGASPEAIPAGTGLGAPNLSQTKQDFFEYVGNGCTDDQVNYLGSIVHFIDNENFMLELNQLLQKYGNNS
jgi:hypothetical protein